MSGIKSLDSTNGYGNGASKVVREQKQVKQETIDLKPQSPYLKDRREYDATRLEGSDKEDSWQDVKSRKQEIDEALKDLNKIKLNIVF